MTDKNNKPNEAEDEKTESIGIPSVAARKRNTSKIGTFSALLLILVLLIIIGFGFYQKNKSGSKQDEKPQVERSFSSKALTLLPLSEIQPIEEPKPVIKHEPEPQHQVQLQQPEPQIVPLSVPDQSLAMKEEKKEPTLEEKRNMAPMMGQANSIASDTETKGLAASFREEGYNSGQGGGGKLGSLLSSVSTPATRAAMMPDRNLLLAKGTFIDCILETKLDTTVPGMTSCVLPRDIYSANGKVLLLERGSKAIGEYKGAVENGLNRIFVLWTQIQTPKGVRINLDSPATDSLGGAGMAGDIDFHWWARFGNALLFTLVQDAFEFGMTKQTENNGGVNYYQNSEDGMKEIIREAMRQSGNIPPTLTKNQGERVGIFVARDVDFSTVYRLDPISRNGGQP